MLHPRWQRRPPESDAKALGPDPQPASMHVDGPQAAGNEMSDFTDVRFTLAVQDLARSTDYYLSLIHI